MIKDYSTAIQVMSVIFLRHLACLLFFIAQTKPTILCGRLLSRNNDKLLASSQ